jgi:hypothetical protein
MAGRGSDTTSGDIRKLLAAKNVPVKTKESVRKASKSQSSPSKMTIDRTAYYLNKGETISFQGNRYFAHMTKIPFRVNRHDVHFMEEAIIFS